MKKDSVSTSVDQSLKLLQLGIDPNTASITWVALGRNCEWERLKIPYKDKKKDKFYAYRPAWTLEDLLKIAGNETCGHVVFRIFANGTTDINMICGYGTLQINSSPDESYLDLLVRSLYHHYVNKDYYEKEQHNN